MSFNTVAEVRQFMSDKGLEEERQRKAKSKKNRGKFILNQEERKRGIKRAFEEAFTEEETMRLKTQDKTGKTALRNEDQVDITVERDLKVTKALGKRGRPFTGRGGKSRGSHNRGGKSSKDNRGGKGQQAKKQKANLDDILANNE